MKVRELIAELLDKPMDAEIKIWDAKGWQWLTINNVTVGGEDRVDVNCITEDNT